tara:strand:+ start:143 stop:643 length:501 start_codon:yes stop_codon:yes gene_type:complete
MTDEYDDEEYDDEDYLIPEKERKGVLEKALIPALNLESEGDPEAAWRILYDQWLSYTDHEYFDYEMASLFSLELDQLFERNPSLLGEKIQKICDECSIDAYHSGGGHDVAMVEAGFKLAENANRPDLELELLEHHVGLQVARYGPSYRDTEGLREKLAELRESAQQ